ncbi:MAG: AI-2E family transporter [Acetatifactor sp.]
MKFKINNKYFRWGLTAFLVLAASIGFWYLVFHGANIKSNIAKIFDILMPVVVGMGLAYLLTPVMNYIETKCLIPLCNRLKLNESRRRNKTLRGISIVTTLFLFVGIIYILIYMLISQIVPSVQNIIKNFDIYSTNIIDWLNRIMENHPDIGNFLINTVDKYSGEIEVWLDTKLPDTLVLIRKVSLSVLGVFGVLWDFIIGLIISIYVLASKDKFAGQAKKIAYAVFEQDTANSVIRIFRYTHKTFVGFLSGKIADSLIIGMICFICTTIMQTPYAALVSVIIGLTNIIPFFGPFLGAVPSAILIFIVDPMKPLNVLYFLIFILVLQQVDGNFIGPKILGSSTGLTGFWVIFAITLFGGLFGVIGMVVGVPLFAVIYSAIKSIVHSSLKKKQLPTDTDKYKYLDYVDENGIHEMPEIPEAILPAANAKEHNMKLSFPKIKKKSVSVESKIEEREKDEVSDTKSK